jgi:hypothetical protein
MVAGTETLTAAKIGDSRSVLLKQHVNPASLQAGDEEVVAVEGIGEK